MTPGTSVNRSLLAIVASMAITVAGFAQTKKALPDSGITIITKVPFEGKNYYITIVPIDTSIVDNMPIVGSHSRTRPTMFWPDSIQKLFPDSVLRRISKRWDQLPHGR